MKQQRDLQFLHFNLESSQELNQKPKKEGQEERSVCQGISGSRELAHRLENGLTSISLWRHRLEHDWKKIEIWILDHEDVGLYASSLPPYVPMESMLLLAGVESTSQLAPLPMPGTSFPKGEEVAVIDEQANITASCFLLCYTLTLKSDLRGPFHQAEPLSLTDILAL